MEKSVRTPEKFGEDLQRPQISSEPGYAIQLKSGDSKYSATRENTLSPGKKKKNIQPHCTHECL